MEAIMKKQADYIKRIEIKRLWGRKNISWDLRPDVNILSGINGIGKSTILNNSVRSLNALEGGALTNGAQHRCLSSSLPKMPLSFTLTSSAVSTDRLSIQDCWKK